MKKAFILIGFIFLCLTGYMIYVWQRTADLTTLQREYILAENAQDREKLIRKVELYYQQQKSPDSLQQMINENINHLLDSLRFDSEKLFKKSLMTKNVYETENEVLNLLTYACAAVLKNQKTQATKIMLHLKKLAITLDKKMKISYWEDFVAQFEGDGKDIARHWLAACQARSLCKKYDSNDQKWKEAEIYAGLALQYLRKVNDMRLRLDVMQSLQYILYQYRAFHEISFGLSKKYLPVSVRIRYKMREMGLRYNYAKAMHDQGHNIQSLQEIRNLLQMVDDHPNVPGQPWYKCNAKLAMVEILWKNGSYQKALREAGNIDISNLSIDNQLRLSLAKGNILDELGKYEIAEKEYIQALKVAQEEKALVNQIKILSNLGVHFESQSELDKALKYSEEALQLLVKENPENYSERFRILMNRAEILYAKKNQDEFALTIEEAEKYLEPVKMPMRKARRLVTLARLNAKAGKYEKAQAEINQAVATFESNGLLQLELGARIDLVQILMQQKKYKDALQGAALIYKKANSARDKGKVIEAMALSAELYLKRGQENEAAETYEKLAAEIEDLSSLFTDPAKLILYRQKIYDILKKRVLFACQKKDYKRAMQYLDYAKARVFKCVKDQKFKNSKSLLEPNLEMICNRLDKKSMVLDYLIMPDSLFLFMFDKDTIKVYAKKIRSDSLQRIVSDYMQLIKTTIGIYNDYRERDIINHFKKTVVQSYKIRQIILGWPEIANAIHSIDKLFIIPDEFLYQLPFASLVIARAPEARFLVQEAEITIVPALSLIPDQKSSVDKMGRAVVSANPEFKKSAMFLKATKNLIPNVGELSLESEELLSAKAALGKIKNYNTFISVNHGLADYSEPELSYLDLYVRSRKGHSGHILRLRLNTVHTYDFSGLDFVMLFGCETSAGKLYRGSGMRGFEQEFLLAGVNHVLAALWKVDAAITIPFAQRILQEFLKGKPLAASLRSVQLENIEGLKSDAYYQKPHPYFWSGISVSSVN